MARLQVTRVHQVVQERQVHQVVIQVHQVVTQVLLADIPAPREHPVGSKGRALRHWPRSNHPNPKC